MERGKSRESNDERGASGYDRPRRPNPETINYLRGLPLDVEASKAEVASFLAAQENDGSHEAEQFPQSLAAALSAIDEVRMEIASLAGDEHGSQCLEVLAHISAPYSETAARVLLSACSGYHLHLATHRYGSHVVQTILQVAVSSSSTEDLALHNEAPPFGNYVHSLPTLSELVTGMMEELQDQVTQLAIHVCGSHVLRTLLCVMAGVNLVSSGPSSDHSKNHSTIDSAIYLRGKKKPKKKKKKPTGDDSASSSTSHPGTMQIVLQTNSRLAMEEFVPHLDSLALELLGEPTDAPGELQQLACHPSAGPLLIILLRVLTYSNPKAREMIQKASSDVNGTTIGDFRLGIARPEPTFALGSTAHEMAKRLLCWNSNNEDDQKQVGDVIFGYSGEARGSHVLETLFRLCPDEMHEAIVKYGDFENPSSLQEYSEHDVSNFVVQTLFTTVRNKEQATRLLKAIEKVITGGLALDPSKRRRGILWRTCELAAKYRVSQETLLKAVRIGFGTIQESTDNKTDARESADATKKKKQRRKASALEVKDCIPLLIDLKKPKEEGGKAILDAAGVRAVYHMLHFSPRLCEDVLTGILEGFSESEMEMIARDGLGSRCILDGILEGPSNAPVFATAFKSLFEKLQGRWVSLSLDRVGHHIVKKLFQALPKMDDKAKLVEELVAGGNRLNGNAMGRSVAEECHVNIYRENRKEWRRVMTKPQTKQDKFLEEIVARPEDREDKAKSKRKRKRKRPDQDEEVDPSSKKAGRRLVTDAIIEALTKPKKD